MYSLETRRRRDRKKNKIVFFVIAVYVKGIIVQPKEPVDIKIYSLTVQILTAQKLHLRKTLRLMTPNPVAHIIFRRKHLTQLKNVNMKNTVRRTK